MQKCNSKWCKSEEKLIFVGGWGEGIEKWVPPFFLATAAPAQNCGQYFFKIFFVKQEQYLFVSCEK